MAEEREEEKAEEAATTTTAPFTFDPKAGEVADPKQNPLMDLFKIPSDNMQTLTQPHKELTCTIQKQTAINGQDVLCDAPIIYEDGRHLKLFVDFPKGESKATFIKLQNIVVQILKYCTDNDEDSVRQGAVKVIEGLESEFKESFLEVAIYIKKLLYNSSRSYECQVLDCAGGGGESTNHATKSNLEVSFPSLQTLSGGPTA
jgi:hypothetical protein